MIYLCAKEVPTSSSGVNSLPLPSCLSEACSLPVQNSCAASSHMMAAAQVEFLIKGIPLFFQISSLFFVQTSLKSAKSS